MSHRRVYLGHIDIGPQGVLDLRTSRGEAGVEDIVLYLFVFGIVADEVFMQGSAPLKSHQVLAAYRRLQDAFTRNEQHEPCPIYAFVLSDECNNYTEYLAQRLDFLQTEGERNPELSAYEANSADDTAIKLDRDMSYIHVPKRTQSVSKAFRHHLISTLHSGEVPALKDATAQTALRRIHEKESIQTFSLIDSLELSDASQLANIFSVVRGSYRRANAFGSMAIDSDTCLQFQPDNVLQFVDSIGLSVFMDQPALISSEILFKLRLSESLALLVGEYFHNQTQADLNKMFAMLAQFRLSGKVRSFLKQSPGAAVAAVFQAIEQAGIGSKTINKGIEHLAKVALGDAFDDALANRYYRMFSAIEILRKELNQIIH